MKSIHALVVGATLLAACSSSQAINGGELEILNEACLSLKLQEKRKQCQVTLEKFKAESNVASDTRVSTKAQATQASINFKDIPLGRAGVKEALIELCKQDKQNLPSAYTTKDSCDYSDKRNIISLSYGSLGSSLAIVDLGESDSLDSVEIRKSKLEILGLVTILRDRYGAPKKKINTVENKMGTKFDQEQFTWVDVQGNRITVESIFDKTDQGRVIIESAARVAKRGIVEMQIKEASKSNL